MCFAPFEIHRSTIAPNLSNCFEGHVGTETLRIPLWADSGCYCHIGTITTKRPQFEVHFLTGDELVRISVSVSNQEKACLTLTRAPWPFPSTFIVFTVYTNASSLGWCCSSHIVPVVALFGWKYDPQWWLCSTGYGENFTLIESKFSLNYPNNYCLLPLLLWNIPYSDFMTFNLKHLLTVFIPDTLKS